MSKSKLSIKNTNPNNRVKLPPVVRHAFTGAAIGGYFGIFYKPTGRGQDFAYAISIAFVMSILITIVRNWKTRPETKTILGGFIRLIIVLNIFWISMELRQIFHDSTGKIGVIIFMTSIGVLLGLIYGIDESRKFKQQIDK